MKKIKTYSELKDVLKTYVNALKFRSPSLCDQATSNS